MPVAGQGRSSCHSDVARLDMALIPIEASAASSLRVPGLDEPDSRIERHTFELHDRI
jgi:hypothetical protein